jgi:isoleucyl-tRNA synthetase
MAKSLGNFISVEEGVKMFQAEVLRLWMLSVDYSDQISVSADYIKNNMADAYRRVRNTFRYLLGNLWDFEPKKHSVPYEHLAEMDKWALDETARLVEGVTRAFDEYELHRVYSLIHNFCTVQMSSLYLEALKDRLYCAGQDWPERRRAQTVLYHVLVTLCRLCAPVLVHTADEVWSHIQHRDEDAESVHLCHWPQPPTEWRSDELHERWQSILAVRDDVARAIEALREKKVVANSMEARVTLWSESDRLRQILTDAYETLKELLVVSELTVMADKPAEEVLARMRKGQSEPALLVEAVASGHPKCARCWNLRPTVGASSVHSELCERCVRAVGAPG